MDSSAATSAWQALARGRRSTRRFVDTPIPHRWLEEMLVEARCAPSGANLQPGDFFLVEGAARQQLSHQLVTAYREGAPAREDYSYFPEPMPMTLRRRQVAAAQALYGALGTARDDQDARGAQFERNFRFFDAPVALVVTIDSRMGSGCFMDLGMCLYGLMLAAAGRGLGSCAIGALASYPHVVREALNLESGHAIVCGLAIGYADPQAPENRIRTTRRDVLEYLHVVR
ncbi:MAG: nitroreductase [Proteobacteria bacterium]|nr:nitroreductase [Pseudomonadota bacterium]